MKKIDPNASAVKKKKNIPDSYVILFAMLMIASIATWFIPAGSFERTTESGTAMVVPGVSVHSKT